MRYLVLFLLGLTATTLAAQTDAAKEQVFLQNARQLIYEGKRSGEGYFSQDGKKLIFQSEREVDNPFYQIYILDLETGDIERVSPGTGKTTCAYFQWNGDKVLYSSTHQDPEAKKKQQTEIDFRNSGQKRRYSWDYDETMDIFASQQDGSKAVNLTNVLGYDAEGSYSPDGKKIAFCSMRDAYGRKLSPEEQKQMEIDASYYGEIYIMDADGKNVKRLTNYSGYDGGPFFSPDGKRIIWRRFTPDGKSADIYTMKIDGTDLKRVTEFKAMSWAPYYHPTQEYIIFASNKLGFQNFELYIVDTAGLKEPVQITHTDGFDGLPVFSPDGTKLSWTSNRTSGGISQIFYANWNHTAALDALKKAPLKGQGGNGFTPTISAKELQNKVEYLASDSLEGRMTGSKGIQAAEAYISKLFNNLGLKPVGKLKDYKHAFEFVSKTQVNKEQSQFSITIGGKREYKEVFTHWLPQSFSMNGSASGDVVFVGYGIKSADKSAVDYNSYDGLDVKGKIVVVFNGTPPHLSDADEKELLRYSTQRYKALVARELGAVGIIFVSELENTFGGVNQENTPGNSGIVAVTINPSVADQLFKGSKLTVADLKARYKEFNPHVKNETALKDVKIDLKVTLDKVQKTDYNVLGMIPASNGSDKYIFIGGHYDHLGYGETSSLANGADKNDIHNGADDNASGTATVIELAEYFAQVKKDHPELITRNLVFILWSGEELGLVGSHKFAADTVVNMKNVEAYINFDMVGRLKDNKLMAQGLGSSTGWKKLLEKKNIAAGFNLIMQDDPYVPTDAMSLYQAGVPVLALFTGIHDDYHRPSDDADKIDYPGMERIAKLAQGVIDELLKGAPIDYLKVEMSNSKAGGTKGFSVYLGTIPDYVAEVKGVRLSGVRPGAPAEKAGLKEGDIIIKLAGKQINDVYDYTNVLGDLQPDKTVEIVIMRENVEKVLEITPGVK